MLIVQILADTACGAAVVNPYKRLSPGTFAAKKSPVEVLKETNWNVRT